MRASNDTLLAIEYARAVIKYRLAPRRLLLLPGLQTRMLSPADTVSRDVFDAARAAYAAEQRDQAAAAIRAQPARTAPKQGWQQQQSSGRQQPSK